MATVGMLWRDGQRRLELARLDPAPGEVRQMLRQVLGWDDLRMVVEESAPVEAAVEAAFLEFMERRLKGLPLGYVLGGAWFMGRWWAVQPGVLIPRPDSEVLVEFVVKTAPQYGRVAEVGVGSGALLGSILLERPDLSGVGSEIDPEVLLQAGANWGRLGLEVRVEGRSGSLLGPMGGEVFDVIFSNPPYIAEAEWAGLEPVVKDHEPRLALVGGADGLEVYRDLVPQALAQLKPGGWLALEIGWQQAAAVRELLPETAWCNILTLKDMAGRDRVVVARRL